MTADFAEIQKKKKGRLTFTDIQLDGNLASKMEELREEHREAVMTDARRGLDVGMDESDLAPKIANKIERLVDRAKGSEQRFTFRSIGRKAYDDLVAKHPPGKEDKKAGLEINIETFPPALVAASSEDPKMTAKQVKEIWNEDEGDWNAGELEKLWNAAVGANKVAGDIPFGRIGIELTRLTDKKSTTASSEGSQEASSSDE